MRTRSRNPVLTLIGLGFYAVLNLVFVIGLFIVAAPNQDNKLTFWFVLLVGLFILYAVFLPANWAFVPNRYIGVKFRLGQAVRDLHGEGLMHVFWPIETVKRVATFDLKRIRIVDIPLGGDKPQHIHVKYLQILYFQNPYLTLQSVPDRDPEIEAGDIVEAAVVRGFHGATIDDVTTTGGTDPIEVAVTAEVTAHPTLARWGVVVRRFEIMDVDYPQSIRDAADDVIRAEGAAKAEDIQAAGRKKAMDQVGERVYTRLEWYEALQKSNIQTLVSFGELVEDVANWLKK